MSAMELYTIYIDYYHSIFHCIFWIMVPLGPKCVYQLQQFVVATTYVNNLISILYDISTDPWHEDRLTACTVGREGVERECAGHEVPDGADGSVKVSNPQENIRSKLMFNLPC